MRNPLSNLSAKTLMERTLSKCRGLFERLRPGVGLRKSSQVWAIVSLVCVALAGCISLVELARRSSSKDEGRATVATTTAAATNLNSAPAKTEKEPGKIVSVESAKKAPQVAKNGKPVPSQVKEIPLTPLQIKPVVSGPPIGSVEEREGEKEDS